MADFSTSDIINAKKRVEEMRKKAQGFVEDEEPSVPPPVPVKNDLFSNLFSNDDSALILAMILILSKEKADNMLILALLYILL